MAQDHRLDSNGQRLDYTCGNRKFWTNVNLGVPHIPGQQHRGSVFGEPLTIDGEYSLWLEHVTFKDNPNDQCYWLMWYKDGIPNMPGSCILHRADIANMSRLLASFVP